MNSHLINVFQDTQRRIWEDELLCQLTSQAVLCTQVFPEKYDTTRVAGGYPTGISVTEETTVQAARRMTERYAKVAVLNFANAVSPGGGVAYGAAAQEEDLCRCSNLYSCLMKPELFEEFYGYNNTKSPYYSDRVIYSTNVTFFKNDVQDYEYTNQWFQADVLTCPAPNLNGITVSDYQKLEKIYCERIRNILAVAEVHGVHALVLGAFGCGAFLNPPELMAKAFYQEVIQGDYKNTFREIVFAVKASSPQGVYNLSIFRSILSPWQQNPVYGKKVSILGDSFSTYWGSSPAGYPTFYTAEQCFRAKMYSVEDTWWMKVIKRLGGTCLVNNSCAGSCVSGNSTFSGNNDQRIYQLAKGTEQPDVILISMGMGDFEYGIPIEADKYEVISNYNYHQYFKISYQMMLWKIKQLYPNAEVYCATIKYGAYDGNTDFLYANGRRGYPLRAYNKAIRECASEYGCRLVDLAEIVSFYETIDGIHPTVVGMSQLADGWMQVLNNTESAYYFHEEEKQIDLRLLLLYVGGGILIVIALLLILLAIYFM